MRRPRRSDVRRVSLIVLALSLLWALLLQVTGGVSVMIAGVHVSSRDPTRPLILAGLALVAFVAENGLAATRATLARAMAPVTPARVAMALALCTTIAGLRYTSQVAGGSDPYGYVSEADLWLRGHVRTPVPALGQVPWPDRLWSFSPLGYRPAPQGGSIVPTYSPGLPLLMAAAKMVAGQRAMFWIVPFSGGLLVAMTFFIGRRFKSDGVGLGAAWLVATSPAMLYMLMWPMSDVPVAAFWALATYAALVDAPAAAFVSGLSASIAILIRPNLAPIAAVFALWLAASDLARRSPGRRPVRMLAFVAGVIPGVAAVALINASLYESAATSGYGDLSAAFAWANVPVNLGHYARWLVDTQTLVAAAGALALVIPVLWWWRSKDTRRAAVLLAGITGVVTLVYCLYMPFHDWWYLRFFLPAWPAVFVSTAFLFARLAEGWPTAVRDASAVAIVALGVHGLAIAGDRGVTGIGVAEHRYAAVAQLVREQTEPSSVVFAMQHSGSVRYYAGRVTIRYDYLDARWLDRAVGWLAQHGAHPYLLVDDWERPEFQKYYAGASPLAPLAMDPVLVYAVGGSKVYLYDLVARNGPARPPVVVTEDPAPRCPLPAPPLELRIVGR